MSINLDLKDRKLIYELDVDGFQSNFSIAKKIGLSKQVVGYRIKRLEQEKIIRKVYTILNLEKLGYYGQKVYFQLQNINEEKEKELINYFKQHNKVVWFGIYEGRYDFVVSIFDKGRVELDKTLSKILKDLQEYITDFDLTTYTNVFAFKKKYLVKQKSSELFSQFGGEEKEIELKETEKNILKILCEDARVTNTDIAENLGISIDTSIKKIKDLRKLGIIQGSRVMLDKRKMDIYEFKVLLNLKNYDPNIHNKFINFSTNNKYVVACIKTIGPWNLELDIEIPSLDLFHPLLLDLKTEFADSIKRIETLMLHDEYKYNFYPFE
jgi:Lrp/AsnC family transcriptional regulator, leucine-responsive regulatory protein